MVFAFKVKSIQVSLAHTRVIGPPCVVHVPAAPDASVLVRTSKVTLPLGDMLGNSFRVAISLGVVKNTLKLPENVATFLPVVTSPSVRLLGFPLYADVQLKHESDTDEPCSRLGEVGVSTVAADTATGNEPSGVVPGNVRITAVSVPATVGVQVNWCCVADWLKNWMLAQPLNVMSKPFTVGRFVPLTENL